MLSNGRENYMNESMGEAGDYSCGLWTMAGLLRPVARFYLLKLMLGPSFDMFLSLTSAVFLLFGTLEGLTQLDCSPSLSLSQFRRA